MIKRLHAVADGGAGFSRRIAAVVLLLTCCCCCLPSVYRARPCLSRQTQHCFPLGWLLATAVLLCDLGRTLASLIASLSGIATITLLGLRLSAIACVLKCLCPVWLLRGLLSRGQNQHPAPPLVRQYAPDWMARQLCPWQAAPHLLLSVSFRTV